MGDASIKGKSPILLPKKKPRKGPEPSITEAFPIVKPIAKVLKNLKETIYEGKGVKLWLINQ